MFTVFAVSIIRIHVFGFVCLCCAQRSNDDLMKVLVHSKTSVRPLILFTGQLFSFCDLPPLIVPYLFYYSANLITICQNTEVCFHSTLWADCTRFFVGSINTNKH